MGAAVDRYPWRIGHAGGVSAAKFSRPGAEPLVLGPSGRLGRPARAAPQRSSPRTLASSRARKHPKGYKDKSVKGYRTSLSRRKPRLSLRLPGDQLLRYADRQLLALLFQLPPRISRFEPDTVVTPGRETWQNSSVELPGNWHVAHGPSCWRRSGPWSPRPSYHRCTVLPALEYADEIWPVSGYKSKNAKGYGTSLSRRTPRSPSRRPGGQPLRYADRQELAS